MNPADKSDYLWDGSGEPDAEVARLEQSLRAYRMAERPLQLAARQSRGLSVRAWRIGFAVAACAAVVLVILAIAAYRTANAGWHYVAEEGRPQVGGKPVRSGILHVGETIETRPGDRVRLRVANIGELEIRDAAQVKLIESREKRQRLSLAYGVVHARVNAPPGEFVLDTPVARAVDLGCEYTLTIAANHAGHLHVDAGWVELTYGYEQSLVPQGADAVISADGAFTPPYFPDAAPAFRSALEQFSLHDELEEAARMELLITILRDARLRDSLSLLNLFRRTRTDAERAAIYDRLNQWVPAPAQVHREQVVAGMRNATAEWWPVVQRALGVTGIKKKGPLNLGFYPE